MKIETQFSGQHLDIDELETSNFDFSTIINDMSISEHIIRLFFSFLNKKRLLDFYLSCGIKHIEDQLYINAPRWYNKEHKALDISFAHNLFKFTKALDVLAPIINTMILNPNSIKIKNPNIPKVEEVVFHALYTSQSIQTYPFSELKLINLFQGVPISQVLQKKQNCVQDYLHHINNEAWEYVDRKYSSLVYLSRLTDQPLMEFLRRFSFNIALSMDYKEPEWDIVTIFAVDSYLENLYNIIQHIEFDKNDIEIVRALHASNKFLYNPESTISTTDIVRASEDLIQVIQEFKFQGTLHKLLCLSKKNPMILEKDNDIVPYSIKEKFCSALQKRVSSTSDILIDNIFSKKIEECLNVILLERHRHLISFGVYNIENNKKIEKISSEKLDHVFVISAIYVFSYYYAIPWLKSFLGFLMVNAEFKDSSSIVKLESAYKHISKFLLKFNSFSEELSTKAPASKRMQNFLDTNDMLLSEDKIRVLKIFIDSMNSQAEILSALFKEFIDDLTDFMLKTTDALNSESDEFITNVSFVKKMMDSSLLPKINDFCTFGQNTERLISLETQILSYRLRGKNE